MYLKLAIEQARFWQNPSGSLLINLINPDDLGDGDAESCAHFPVHIFNHLTATCFGALQTVAKRCSVGIGGRHQ